MLRKDPSQSFRRSPYNTTGQCKGRDRDVAFMGVPFTAVFPSLLAVVTGSRELISDNPRRANPARSILIPFPFMLQKKRALTPKELSECE